jgi:hypothetical protein
MGVIVAFDYAAWVAMYPEFAAVTEPQANNFFAMACQQHSNNGSGPVCDATTQLYLLNLVTAFMAARYSPAVGGDPNGLVGRISSASEGSVSVSAENSYPPGSAQYWQQNRYGSDYWNATKAYRTMRYRANPRPVVNGIYPTGPWGYNPWGI